MPDEYPDKKAEDREKRRQEALDHLMRISEASIDLEEMGVTQGQLLVTLTYAQSLLTMISQFAATRLEEGDEEGMADFLTDLVAAIDVALDEDAVPWEEKSYRNAFLRLWHVEPDD